MTSEIIVIDGKIKDHSYQFKINPELSEMGFIKAMEKNRKVFKSKFLDRETVAISVWTTPKRTKTYPFSRVYDTLGYDGVKITIIPVMVDYGINGERGRIQPNTVDWMTSIGVYLILGVYIDADKGKVGKLAKNAGANTKSSEGKPKFAQGQRFDVEYLQLQIEKIIGSRIDVKTWNEIQLSLIPNFLEKSINNYKKLGTKLDVPLGDFSKLEEQVEKWKKDSVKFLTDCEKNSKRAQDSESRSIHKLEDVPGEKGKINIGFGGTKKLYLTSDSMILDKNKCEVTLLEGKNTSKGKYPSLGDIKDALIKLMIFKNANLSIGEKRLKKKLICYLTGQDKNVEEEFRREHKLLIDECNANEIELQLNKKIIK
jgi:hypothetical protein